MSGAPGSSASSQSVIPLRGGSEPLEALDGEDEDRRAADLDLERVGHEELARLHDRRHRVDDLRPRRAVRADDRHHLVDVRRPRRRAMIVAFDCLRKPPD